MSSDKATQTCTEYYLYHQYEGRSDETYDNFGDACDAARRLPAGWEVHAVNNNRKRK